MPHTPQPIHSDRAALDLDVGQGLGGVGELLVQFAMGRSEVRAPSATRRHLPSSVSTVPKSKATRSRVSTAIRLPADLHAELQRCAEERDVSVNFLVTRAVHHYLQQLPPADPLQAAATNGA